MKKEQTIRIMVAAGGTGGHVYPALAIAEAMTRMFLESSDWKPI